MYHQDWLMSQIQGMVNMIVRMFFKKDTSSYKLANELNHTNTDLLYFEIIGLLKNYKINEAENLLFEKLNTDDLNYLKIALDFYSRLNNLSDDQLEQSGFLREEIKSGLTEVAERFGINIF